MTKQKKGRQKQQSSAIRELQVFDFSSFFPPSFSEGGMVYSDELFSLLLMLLSVLLLLFVKYLECNESKKALRIAIIHFVVSVCVFSLQRGAYLDIGKGHHFFPFYFEREKTRFLTVPFNRACTSIIALTSDL